MYSVSDENFLSRNIYQIKQAGIVHAQIISFSHDQSSGKVKANAKKERKQDVRNGIRTAVAVLEYRKYCRLLKMSGFPFRERPGYVYIDVCINLLN